MVVLDLLGLTGFPVGFRRMRAWGGRQWCDNLPYSSRRTGAAQWHISQCDSAATGFRQYSAGLQAWSARKNVCRCAMSRSASPVITCGGWMIHFLRGKSNATGTIGTPAPTATQ